VSLFVTYNFWGFCHLSTIFRRKVNSPNTFIDSQNRFVKGVWLIISKIPKKSEIICQKKLLAKKGIVNSNMDKVAVLNHSVNSMIKNMQLSSKFTTTNNLLHISRGECNRVLTASLFNHT